MFKNSSKTTMKVVIFVMRRLLMSLDSRGSRSALIVQVVFDVLFC